MPTFFVLTLTCRYSCQWRRSRGHPSLASALRLRHHSHACIPLCPGHLPAIRMWFTTNPTGGFGAIAVVDAFHYPTALTDLRTFSAQFGLKAPNLTVVPAEGMDEQIVWLTVISSAPGEQGFVTAQQENDFMSKMKASPMAALFGSRGRCGKTLFRQDHAPYVWGESYRRADLRRSHRQQGNH